MLPCSVYPLVSFIDCQLCCTVCPHSRITVYPLAGWISVWRLQTAPSLMKAQTSFLTLLPQSSMMVECTTDIAIQALTQLTFEGTTCSIWQQGGKQHAILPPSFHVLPYHPKNSPEECRVTTAPNKAPSAFPFSPLPSSSPFLDLG